MNDNNDDEEARPSMRICTWNVRTLAQAGKVHNADGDGRLKIGIFEISEMRWPGSDFSDIDNHRVYYSGTSNERYEYGVEIIMSNSLTKCVTKFTPISERIMILQLRLVPTNINIIQVFAPTPP